MERDRGIYLGSDGVEHLGDDCGDGCGLVVVTSGTEGIDQMCTARRQTHYGPTIRFSR